MEQGNSGIVSLDQAGEEFQKIVDTQRLMSLWFVDPMVELDVTHPQALKILDLIARHCSGAMWVQV